MLSLTKKTDYALVALTCLAHRAREGQPPVGARRLAEEHGLPVALVMNILKELHQAKILQSTRGPQGGYALHLAPEQVTLMEVITAMEGPFRVTECADNLPVIGQGCQIACRCPIREPIRRLHERIQEFFDGVTLADLMDNRVDIPLSTLERQAARRPRGANGRAQDGSVGLGPDTDAAAEAPGWLKPVAEMEI